MIDFYCVLANFNFVPAKILDLLDLDAVIALRTAATDLLTRWDYMCTYLFSFSSAMMKIILASVITFFT